MGGLGIGLLLFVVNADVFLGGSDAGFGEPQQTTPIQPIQTEPVMYDVLTPADISRVDGLIVAHHMHLCMLGEQTSCYKWVTFDSKQPFPPIGD